MASMLILFLAAGSAPNFETFSAPGYSAPVCGAWYQPGEASSAMPLGGLGTGFIDFTSAATFGDNTIENNWLKPRPTNLSSHLSVNVAGRSIDLRPNAESSQSLRFWGHYPAADVDFGSTFENVRVYLRAFAPVIPHDAETSGLPVALFRFRVTNEGKEDKPVEVGMQWEKSRNASLEATGNVEGALCWQKETLAPGETWLVTPFLKFAASKKPGFKIDVRSFLPHDPLEGAEAPEGRAYTIGEIKDLLLDSLGGFDWETHRRQSAALNGAPTIGQIFWQLDYDKHRAGRGPSGGYGLSGSSLPATTADGKIEVSLQVAQHGKDTVKMIFSIRNVSGQPIDMLRFGYCINADLGGPKHAERQQAKFEELGIVFAGNDDQPMLMLQAPDAIGCIVSTWPNAHLLAAEGQWVSLNKQARQIDDSVVSISDGLQTIAPHGSVAIAARADTDDWTIQAVRTQGTVTKATAKKTLAPGESSIVTLALAWNFPEWISSDGERLRHSYAKYADAGAVIAAALPNAKQLEERVIAWQEKIYSSNVPGLLKDAVINSLYILPRNSWWIDDGRFFQSESFTGCPITETFVCRFNGSFPLALMWPDLEKATMRAVAAAQAETGEIPFGFGSPAGSRSPYFHVQHPIVSPEFVLTAWRNYRLTGDPSFLMYDRVQKALRYAMTLDKDGDGLVNEDPGSDKGFPANQYYDIWPWWGTSAYTGSIWLAALRAGEEIAKLQNDQPFADELRGWFERGRAAFEDKLWAGDARARYYRLYNDPAGKRKSDTLLANGLCGQWFAYAAGLGDLLPKERIDSHISAVLRLNAAATEYGTVNGVTPDGKPDTTFPGHSAVLTIGETWNFCAMAAFAGRTADAISLFEKSYSSILLNQRTPWNISWSLDPKTGAIKWGINYYSNPCVWTLFQALAPDVYAALASSN
ncbi:MAG TPA: GH116 family glycosyl hydrolase [Candidatus Bathyarchaeia archaeon]|nr:GH116 family glycosyl hydrolase [Candidatus Bathyarchaeia archaeon]